MRNNSMLRDECLLGPFDDFRDEIIDWWNDWNKHDWYLGKKHLLVIGETRFIEFFVGCLAFEQINILRPLIKTIMNEKPIKNTIYHLSETYERNRHNLILVSNFKPNNFDKNKLRDFLQDTFAFKNVAPAIFNIPNNQYATRSFKQLESIFKLVYVTETEENNFNSDFLVGIHKETQEYISNTDEEKSVNMFNYCNLI
jgi:hypothetical protein